MTSWIVWLVCAGIAAALAFVGYWFSLRRLRLFTVVTAVAVVLSLTRYGLTHPGRGPGDVVDAFLRGVDAVIVGLLGPLWRNHSVPVPGDADRWVIAAFLLLGYRQLEAWTLRWQAPVLDLSAIGPEPGGAGTESPAAVDGPAAPGTVRAPTPGKWHAQLAAELRFRLTSMEVRSPAILPGGTKANALASIAETSGVSGAGMLSAFLRLAAMFWPGPRQIRVRTWVESPAATRITVLLEDVRTGLPVATNTVAGENFTEAASMVAGYIARQIFGMDRTVPDWCYGVADGRDLGAMQLARLQRVYAACPKDMASSRDLQICTLRQSTGINRTAGIIRYELAQLLALRRQHLESLRLHALNRELHDRFYRGRYRLAMSLEMIANPEHYLPDEQATRDTLREILEILSRCQLTGDELDVTRELREVEMVSADGQVTQCLRISTELARELLTIAARDLSDVRKQLTLPRVIRDSLLHRDERAVWLPHWRRRHRQAFRDGVCVAELLIAVRRRLLDPQLAIPSWLMRTRDRWHLRLAATLTLSVAGDRAFLTEVLTNPAGPWWWAADRPAPRPAPATGRRRPWQRRTASWQAAYNTACLYAALADAARANAARTESALAQTALTDLTLAEVAEAALADTIGGAGRVLGNLELHVVSSLRHAVNDRFSELERPSDWIDSDPDFHAMSQNPRTFEVFEQFLLDQQQQDYPVAFLTGLCPVNHPVMADAPEYLLQRLMREAPGVISPVPGHAAPSVQPLASDREPA